MSVLVFLYKRDQWVLNLKQMINYFPHVSCFCQPGQNKYKFLPSFMLGMLPFLGFSGSNALYGRMIQEAFARRAKRGVMYSKGDKVRYPVCVECAYWWITAKCSDIPISRRADTHTHTHPTNSLHHTHIITYTAAHPYPTQPIHTLKTLNLSLPIQDVNKKKYIGK